MHLPRETERDRERRRDTEGSALTVRYYPRADAFVFSRLQRRAALPWPRFQFSAQVDATWYLTSTFQSPASPFPCTEGDRDERERESERDRKRQRETERDRERQRAQTEMFLWCRGAMSWNAGGAMVTGEPASSLRAWCASLALSPSIDSRAAHLFS